MQVAEGIYNYSKKLRLFRKIFFLILCQSLKIILRLVIFSIETKKSNDLLKIVIITFLNIVLNHMKNRIFKLFGFLLFKVHFKDFTFHKTTYAACQLFFAFLRQFSNCSVVCSFLLILITLHIAQQNCIVKIEMKKRIKCTQYSKNDFFYFFTILFII